MKKLILIALIALTACTKEVEVEKIIYQEKIVEVIVKDQTKINELQSQITLLNTSNSDLQSQLDALQIQLNEAYTQEDIDSLEMQIEVLEATIDGLVNIGEEVSTADQTFTENYGGYYRRSNSTSDRLHDVGLGKFIIYIYQDGCYTTTDYSALTFDWIETPYSLEFSYNYTDPNVEGFGKYRWEYVNGQLQRRSIDGYYLGYPSKYSPNEDITDYICE